MVRGTLEGLREIRTKQNGYYNRTNRNVVTNGQLITVMSLATTGGTKPAQIGRRSTPGNMFLTKYCLWFSKYHR